ALLGALDGCEVAQSPALWAGFSLSTEQIQHKRAPTLAAHHKSRRPICVTLALLPELRVLRIPVSAMAVGLFGWLNTLKNSTSNRSAPRSLILQNLNKDRSWNPCHGPFMY